MPTQPPAPVTGHLKMRVRTVEGPFVTLELPPTDYHVVLGQHCDYLVGHGVAHAFSKDGMFILSGPVPAILEEDQASLIQRAKRRAAAD